MTTEGPYQISNMYLHDSSLLITSLMRAVFNILGVLFTIIVILIVVLTVTVDSILLTKVKEVLISPVILPTYEDSDF